ncbi:uncharacterized protein NECHADRAFT_79451 [Fusarium vanettenii 77-13-4]|uniref:DUF5672 domain-containing protein n=1 Tax=Fusarium vanettenii (strain ATCC MYA-4622 / CBS 123669 / FGSC 9596 / NRRL 45880 / 77-13-4) TaxID=660122 RepID=C7YNW8_FUSV7|nr:uncharacterized protein NECHADRAFT_79451 [Fusarium vanettenii 77-13-4]EEU46648.1 hypothetical protein NECHADRAFT_79451 [Fusarium vanettenii 77-13-4]
MSKLALLIEPRPSPHLAPLVLHMMSVVPRDWPFLMIGSQQSVALVAQAHAIQYRQRRGKISFQIISSLSIAEDKDYSSSLLTDPKFYESLPGVEWILRYESDSILCANSPKGLDEFLDSDWTSLGSTDAAYLGGSGGLSLRRISAIRRILSFQKRLNNSEPSDEWFMKRLRVHPGKAIVPGPSKPGLVGDHEQLVKPMGYHVPLGGDHLDSPLWRDTESRQNILDYCPELSMILDMKLERERCPPEIKQDWTFTA